MSIIQNIWNKTIEAKEILEQMDNLIRLVAEAKIADEPLTAQQLINIRTRFNTLKNQAITLLQSI